MLPPAQARAKFLSSQHELCVSFGKPSFAVGWFSQSYGSVAPAPSPALDHRLNDQGGEYTTYILCRQSWLPPVRLRRPWRCRELTWAGTRMVAAAGAWPAGLRAATYWVTKQGISGFFPELHGPSREVLEESDNGKLAMRYFGRARCLASQVWQQPL